MSIPAATPAGAPGLDLAAPPFDLLTPAQADRVRRAVDIVYFPPRTRILQAGTASAAAYVILKGRVGASDRRDGASRHFADYEAGELFGAFAALSGRARHDYDALEDTLCFALPAPLFVALTEENARFGAYFHESLSVKRQLLDERDQPSDLSELMLTRIRDALVLDAIEVTPQTPISTCVAAMRERHADGVLVREPGRLGIATRTDLLDALALRGSVPADAVGPHATFPALALEEDEFLFQALVTMTQRHIHRVVVTRAGVVRGTLGLMEVLSHFSGKSHVVSFRLARADSVEALSDIAGELGGLVRTLHAQGAKTAFLMDLMSALNGRLMARLYEFTVPTEVRARTALLVLGSEGRGEQILKTDQDNALVLADDLAWPGLAEAMQRYSAQLVGMGFPPCPGGIMVSNPAWCRSQADWLRQIDAWVARPDPEAVMNLAIAFDAHAVAGDPAWFAPVRDRLHALGDNEVALRAFAQKAVDFETPLGLFGRLVGDARGTDLKKGGIFPLVHGLRTLALKHRIAPTNSYRRAEALIAAGVLDPRSGSDLMQALSVLIRIRLGEQLRAMREGRDPDNHVDGAALRRLDRDVLRDALRVVNEFKRWLTLRFQLD